MISLAKLSADITRDIRASLQPSVDLSDRQKSEIAAALDKLVRANLGVPESDPRAVALLRDLPGFAGGLTARLDPTEGLVVEDPRGSDAGLLIERGSRWLRGADWRNAAAACVSRETTSKP